MVLAKPAKYLCSFGHMHQIIAKANEGIQKPACTGGRSIQTACMLRDACKVSAGVCRETWEAVGTCLRACMRVKTSEGLHALEAG